MKAVKMGNKGDDFGDRMKGYEMREAGRRCLPLLPICVRLDGKNFSRFTKGLGRPFDMGFIHLMQGVTKRLVEETGAKIGYCQSDEISLILFSDSLKSQVYFDGRIQKLCSVLSSMTTAFFNGPERGILLPSKMESGPAMFDCRVWSVPNKMEAANAILWRERDATKNAIQSAARSVYSHKQCHDKDTGEMLGMLLAAGINFEDYPFCFKHGTFYQRHTTKRRFTAEELEKLPPKHDARKNPDLEIERSEVRQLEFAAPFDTVINRVEVLFDGAVPLYNAKFVTAKWEEKMRAHGHDMDALKFPDQAGFPPVEFKKPEGEE